MTSDCPNKKRSNGATPNGFTFVEAIVSTLILALAAMGSLLVFTTFIKSSLSTRNESEIQAAINSDLSTILQINRRLTCNAGTSLNAHGCSVQLSDPTENDYFPNPDSSGAVESFTSLCKNQGFVPQIATTINSTPVPNGFSTLGLRRNSVITELNPISVTSGSVVTTTPTATGHRYIVSWSRLINNSYVEVRQITLAPTVANWCP